MKRNRLIFIFIIFYHFCVSQTHQTPLLSQNTNYSLLQSTKKLMYIASINGLNVYDGRCVKVFSTHNSNMIGNNIQGRIIEDDNGKIWFSTYEALHCLIPNENKIIAYQFCNSKKDTLKTDYLLFDFCNDSLYLKTGNELVIFHTEKKKIVYRNNFQLLKYHYFAILKNRTQKQLLYGMDTLWCKEIDHPTDIIFFSPQKVNSIYSPNNINCYVGTTNGEILSYNPFSIKTNKTIQISKKAINGIFSKNDTLICTSSDNLYYLKLPDLQLIKTEHIFHPKSNYSFTNLLIPYIDNDNILWVGNDGDGVFFKDLKQPRFEHWLSSNACELRKNITQLIEHPKYIIALSRGSGIFLLHKNGSIAKNHEFKINGNSSFTAFSGTLLNNNELLFTDQNDIFKLNLVSNKIVKLKCKNQINPHYFFKIEKINTKIIAVSTLAQIIEFQLSNAEYSYKTFIGNGLPNPLTYFLTTKNKTLFANYNSEKTFVYINSEKYELAKEIKEIKSIRDIKEIPNSDSSYLATSEGLYKIHQTNFGISKIEDTKNQLNQMLYSVYVDKNMNVWLSSNTGIWCYYPSTNTCQQFSNKDGVQGNEFNTSAHLQTKDGRILMGGVNGINCFIPENITLSTKKSKIIIDEYKINDQSIENKFKNINDLQELNLNYFENTISLQFHTIDYAAPIQPKLRYLLENVDNDFIEIDNYEAFVRYPKLKSGEYTFIIQATNADGIWGNEYKKIKITINPPYWERWWFRLFILLLIGSISYLIAKQYIKQKIAKKDIELREQKIKYEQQIAIQAERNRIASEMHDDLGGGLTTINYLSQRILGKIEDDTIKEKVEKIMNQSNELVTNMSEIIWTMNSNFDTLESTITYIRHYSAVFLEQYHISLNFNSDINNPDFILSSEMRRNILLIVKELLHNISKHSKASVVNITIHQKNEKMIWKINDNGIGFDQPLNTFGNGLTNIKRRVLLLNGKLSIDTNSGTTITFIIPMTNVI